VTITRDTSASEIPLIALLKDDGAISADHPLILIQVQYNKEMVETKPAVFWSRLLKVLKYHL
jgi:hypothetical protein